MRTCNWKNWAVHMDGLELVYRARGGFEELPPDMKTMILWLVCFYGVKPNVNN